MVDLCDFLNNLRRINSPDLTIREQTGNFDNLFHKRETETTNQNVSRELPSETID